MAKVGASDDFGETPQTFLLLVEEGVEGCITFLVTLRKLANFGQTQPAIGVKDAAFVLTKARLPRITSYNVCYTKLLRTANPNFVSTVRAGADRRYSMKALAKGVAAPVTVNAIG